MRITNNKFIRDLLSVLVSNGIVLVGSIVTGFIIPKMLGVTEYGYYKIFTLYLGYISLLHFGFVDGILLEVAGKKYYSLNKKKFRLNTQFFIVFQLVISLVIVLFSIFVISDVYRILFLLLGFDAIAINVTSYFQYISQGTMRFKELSVRKILLAILKVILAISLLSLVSAGIIDKATAYDYIIGIVAIDIVLTIWYIITYKDITFGDKVKFKNGKKEIMGYFKSGIVLTISFQISNIIFSLDQVFVSALYDANTYGIYSFAYNLLSIGITIISAVSLVLFPSLKQKNEKDIIRNFSNSMTIISIVTFAAMIGYYPLCKLIKWFLPEYTESLTYFTVLLPGLTIICCINIIMFTYYKVLNKQVVYFRIACIVAMLSALLNYVAYALYQTPFSISVASIITLIIWYIGSELFFIKTYNVAWKKNIIYLLILMTVFYFTSMFISNEILAVVLYSLSYVVITFFMFKELLIKISYHIRMYFSN